MGIDLKEFENYNTNIGLIRKRIKDEDLYLKEFVIGNKTNTKVCIMYMDNLVDKDLLNEVVVKIKSIKTDKILDNIFFAFIYLYLFNQANYIILK